MDESKSEDDKLERCIQIVKNSGYLFVTDAAKNHLVWRFEQLREEEKE